MIVINIDDKKSCTGCGACIAKCPYKAISLVEDGEGVVYPSIDPNVCRACNLCDEVCHMRREKSWYVKENIDVYAARLKKDSMLLQVASGGAFYALASTVLKQKGVVYGAAQMDLMHVAHIRVSDVKGLNAVLRSKYLQSSIVEVFSEIKMDIKRGLLVLFSGVPCQIAALYSFLGKDYDNLITCEVICHGVPSIGVFRKYIEEMNQLYNTPVKEIIYRDKTYGWKKNNYKIEFENGDTLLESSNENIFHRGYLDGLYYRPSCGNCHYATMPRVADITLADYWHYLWKGKEDCTNGISMILINSIKGEKILKAASKELYLETSELEFAKKTTRHLCNAPVVNTSREKFFKLYGEKGFFVAARKYESNPNPGFMAKVKNKIFRSMKNVCKIRS